MAGKFDKVCAYCSNHFKGRFNSLFCSTSCRSNHWQRNKKALVNNEPLTKKQQRVVRRFYISAKVNDLIVSCQDCKKKGEIGLFYFQLGGFRIKCDNCGLTFSKD